MSSIIKKGTNASAFRLKDGKLITLEPDVLVVLKEDIFEELMREYGSFITPRIITEANPNGCFIVNRKSDFALDMNKEVGKIKDNSAQIEVTTGIVAEAPKEEPKEEPKKKAVKRSFKRKK